LGQGFGRAYDFFHHLAQFLTRAADQGDRGSGESKSPVTESPQPAGRLGYFRNIALQIQGQGAGGEIFRSLGFQRRGMSTKVNISTPVLEAT